MSRVIKKIINNILNVLFLFVKDNFKKAKIYSEISKLIFDKNNSLEYDEELNAFWLKHNSEYLFAVKKPYYNFSKKNLYKSINDIYCKMYQPKNGDIILDIGAGIGTELVFFNEKIGKEGKIYSIEASSESYNKLIKLCNKNNFTNTFNFNIAISNLNGKIWIEEGENFEVNQINTHQKGIEIPCYTLDNFIELNHLKKINFLKVNIEGAEFEMIDGMQKSICIIDNIAISCHDFLFNDDRKIKNKVVQFLRENNFEIIFNNTGNKISDSWIYGTRK